METNQELELEASDQELKKQSSSARYLVIFTLSIVAIALLASAYILIFQTKMDNGEPLHWMGPMGVAVMVIFMPLTAVSFLQFRLPQKKREFADILATLHAESERSERSSFIVNAEYKGPDYLLPVVFVTFFSVLGFHILFANNGLVLLRAMVWATESADNSYRIYASSLVSFGFAFLGAYIWSIQYIFRRMVTLDLPPGAYYSVGTRLVFSSFVALLYSHLTFNYSLGTELDMARPPNMVEAQLPLIAFLAGVFPERLLNWMRDSLGGLFSRKKHQAKVLPLEMIEGISSFQKARLSELGIDNIQNLAHGSLVEISIKTPFKPRVVADWMAQARLCLEFKSQVNKIRESGVRSILDFLEIAEAGLLEELAQRSKLDITLLQAVYCANKDEQSIKRLREAYDILSVV